MKKFKKLLYLTLVFSIMAGCSAETLEKQTLNTDVIAEKLGK